MLPDFLDVTHMRIITWVVLAVAVIVLAMLVKHLEKSTLRVVVLVIFLVILFGCYKYQGALAKCETDASKQCSFFGIKVPKVDAGINDLNP